MENKINGQVVKMAEAKKDVSGFVKEAFEWGSSIIWAIVATLLMTTFLMVFTVSGSSMLPTLHDGDRLFVNKFMYTPKKGDIVTVNTLSSIDKRIVKRIIATQGDSFKINYDTHEIFLNGELLNEPYINEPTALKGDWEIPEVIPQGYVLVLGDNRNYSLDSRFQEIGLVKVSDVYGKAITIFWPFDRIQLFD